MFKLILISVTVLLWTNTGLSQSCQKARTSPEKPSNLYDVGIVNSNDNGLQRRTLPALSTTRDGRIGLAKLANNPQNNREGFNFFLLKPEIESGDFHRGAGTQPLAMVDYRNLEAVTAHISISELRRRHSNVISSGELMHVTLCESDKNSPRFNRKSQQDIYNVNVVAFEPNRSQRNVTVWTFGVQIKVKRPKTAQAFIDNVSLTSKVGKKIFNKLNIGLEPTITADGKLMIVRTPLRYSYNPRPCDPSGWTEPKFITQARQDPNLKNADGSFKYGFLKYPFRDSMGQAMTKVIGGYPWIDSKGDNLFYLAVNRKIGKGRDAKLNFECVAGGTSCHIDEDGGDFRGITILGLWTQGKAVLLDGILNNTDYPASSTQRLQKRLKLYRNHAGVRITGNRFNTNLRRNRFTGAAFGNLSVIESLENKLNYNRVLAPSTPRDVVWKVTRGAVTDEVVFDEYVDPNYIIYSQMVGAVENSNDTYYDGFQSGSNGCYHGQVRVQNSASSFKYRESLPAYGFLHNSAAGRIEPVSLGGVYGKGLWLTAANGLKYNMKKRLIESGNTTFFSMFFDLRQGANRRWVNLVTSPSGVHLQAFVDSRPEIYRFRLKNGGKHKSLNFRTKTKKGNWIHIAVIEKGNETLVTLNGNERVKVDNRGFKMNFLGYSWKSSQIRIGMAAAGALGFRGWIDDVRLIVNADVYADNPELSCNMARGSILKRNQGRLKGRLIANYNLSGHRNYFCNTNYRQRNFKIADAFKGLSPRDFAHRRDQFILRGKDIVFNKPRPHAAGNKFCLTCHVDTGDRFRPASLKTAALRSSSSQAQHDLRRQPMQPPKKWTGFMPQNLFRSFNKRQLGPERRQLNCGRPGNYCNIDELLYD